MMFTTIGASKVRVPEVQRNVPPGGSTPDAHLDDFQYDEQVPGREHGPGEGSGRFGHGGLRKEVEEKVEPEDEEDEPKDDAGSKDELRFHGRLRSVLHDASF